MKTYNPNKPLIHIHVPKTGGVTVREIYKSWFGNGLFFHYFSVADQMLPKKQDLDVLSADNKQACLFGHFNRARDFGIEHYYPEVDQFITIVRDPFERCVSGYFYSRRDRSDQKQQSNFPDVSLREHILSNRNKEGMIYYLPLGITMDNYKEVIESQFVEIGVLDYLDESMRRIANKLNFEYDVSSLVSLNTSNKDQPIPYDLRQWFYENNPLSYAIYKYALSKYV